MSEQRETDRELTISQAGSGNGDGELVQLQWAALLLGFGLELDGRSSRDPGGRRDQDHRQCRNSHLLVLFAELNKAGSWPEMEPRSDT